MHFEHSTDMLGSTDIEKLPGSENETFHGDVDYGFDDGHAQKDAGGPS